jgi:hypothetical protein
MDLLIVSWPFLAVYCGQIVPNYTVSKHLVFPGTAP